MGENKQEIEQIAAIRALPLVCSLTYQHVRVSLRVAGEQFLIPKKRVLRRELSSTPCLFFFFFSRGECVREHKLHGSSAYHGLMLHARERRAFFSADQSGYMQRQMMCSANVWPPGGNIRELSACSCRPCPALCLGCALALASRRRNSDKDALPGINRRHSHVEFGRGQAKCVAGSL